MSPQGAAVTAGSGESGGGALLRLSLWALCLQPAGSAPAAHRAGCRRLPITGPCKTLSQALAGVFCVGSGSPSLCPGSSAPYPALILPEWAALRPPVSVWGRTSRADGPIRAHAGPQALALLLLASVSR